MKTYDIIKENEAGEHTEKIKSPNRNDNNILLFIIVIILQYTKKRIF